MSYVIRVYTKTIFLGLCLCNAAHAKKQSAPPAPTPTYSCSAVLADNYYVPAGQTIIINAQVDCLFFTGLGTAATITEVPINIANNSMFKVPVFTQDKAYKLEGLNFYPAQEKLFAFEYQPLKGSLKNNPIQVVIRSEPLDPSFIKMLTTQQQRARTQQNSQMEQELNDILNHKAAYNKVVFYRRLPTMGETHFTPKHTKVLKRPEQKIADIRVLPTGNLHIVDHTSTGEQFLVEESFGKL